VNPPTDSVDLHGKDPESALRALAQALHAARVRGAPSLRVITGRGWATPTMPRMNVENKDAIGV
jgi:DNA-nicking Smr family endonuclease